jgi:hypothetical protein
MAQGFPVEDIGPAKSPPRGLRRLAVTLFYLGLVAFLPVTCCVNTISRGAEDRRLADEAWRLGGGASVPPGDAGWDGLGLSAYSILDLSNTKTGDADLARLVDLPAFARVRSLSLEGTPITDSGLAILEKALGSKKLILGHVNVAGTSVTEAKVRSLNEARSWPVFVFGPPGSVQHPGAGRAAEGR